eukprot:TRINITY_DN2272_c0_g1_i1.p1 TRINITY_DN2272_c0_g1~~TRINITY_DN2272_c0_g1_i1.p1  ORF type:complete len:273 (-),score=96.61 TRINITY_DN2272_c0_g1_i1:54-851(-)
MTKTRRSTRSTRSTEQSHAKESVIEEKENAENQLDAGTRRSSRGKSAPLTNKPTQTAKGSKKTTKKTQNKQPNRTKSSQKDNKMPLRRSSRGTSTPASQEKMAGNSRESLEGIETPIQTRQSTGSNMNSSMDSSMQDSILSSGGMLDRELDDFTPQKKQPNKATRKRSLSAAFENDNQDNEKEGFKVEQEEVVNASSSSSSSSNEEIFGDLTTVKSPAQSPSKKLRRNDPEVKKRAEQDLEKQQQFWEVIEEQDPMAFLNFETVA